MALIVNGDPHNRRVRYLPSVENPKVVTVEVPSRATASRAARFSFRPEDGKNYLVLIQGYNARTSIKVEKVIGGEVLWQYSDGHGMCFGLVVESPEDTVSFCFRKPAHHGHGSGQVLYLVANFPEAKVHQVALTPEEEELLTEDEVWSLVQERIASGRG